MDNKIKDELQKLIVEEMNKIAAEKESELTNRVNILNPQQQKTLMAYVLVKTINEEMKKIKNERRNSSFQY